MRPRRRLWRRILAIVVAVLLVALVGGYAYASPLLNTATGYAAHNACAVRFVAGRANPEADLPPNPLVPYLRTSTDDSAGTATTSILGVLAKQTATVAPDGGCTLGGAPGSPAQRPTIDAGRNPYATMTVSPDGAVDAAIARAFGDDLDAAGQKRLGTRAVVVLRGGKLVGERYAEGFTPQTRQLGWSMAKSVTNLVTGRMVEQGRVSVQDKGLRPEWTDARQDITLDQLERMSSGLAWDETYDLGTPITRMLYLESDMPRYVASLPGTHAPGTYQQYSSGSTNLVCSYLRSKHGPGDLETTTLFEPLGLTSAVWERDVAGTPVCSSYLWATPRDWAAIGQFALQGGRWNGQQLLPADWMRSSTTATKVTTTEDPGYAAGWWANTAADGSRVDPVLPAEAYAARGHDGQQIVVVPSKELVVVRLGFSPGVKGADLRVSELVATLAR